jgi:hypothetical protein
MSCVAPRPRWRAGLFHPLSATLWITGVLCTAAGAFLTGGLAGVLPPIGAAFVLLGTSNGAVSALNLGSVFKLTSGSRIRVESLTKECESLQPRIESVAQVLCKDPEAVRRTVGLAVTNVSREWSSGFGDPFSMFLLCRTISIAREQDAIFGDGSASDAERETHVMRALHSLCGVPVSDIARMLDRDIGDVRAALVGSPPRGGR